MAERRPYRLRVLLDLELTEQEWTDLASAQVAPSDRPLVLVIQDGSDGMDLHRIAATPARLELNLDRASRLEQEARIRERQDYLDLDGATGEVVVRPGRILGTSDPLEIPDDNVGPFGHEDEGVGR